MTKVLVVGGGISGTATALVLSRAGFVVDLVERDTVLRTLGSGITLIGPALRALDRLGLLDECLRRGYSCNEWVMCDLGGEVVQRIPTPSPHMDLGTKLPGVLGMTRPDLHWALIEQLATSQVAVRTDLSPTALVDHGDHVIAEFSDGTWEEYDLVVGADGLRSEVRNLVYGVMQPQFQQQACIRAVLPRPAEVDTELGFVGHPTTHIGFTPTRADSMYMYCVVPAADTHRPLQHQLPAILRGYLEPFGGMGAWAREQISDPNLINYSCFETILVPPPWNRGRTVLVGDSAHCTTAHIAAGAAMCLEDAIVLGEALTSTSDISKALDAYTQRRYERCRYVVDTSVTLSHWQTHPDTPGADQERLRAEAFALLAEKT
ncbi:FAD-dependent monooxygenase [Actinoplanes sp. NPDC051343]|uniref:FAD-dependent monooxygenase n=1 Tax=Actinoplanes sp. NPDC051343 TaxID=3363906 RepID=UPI00378AB495